jgi:hypothetical protein
MVDSFFGYFGNFIGASLSAFIFAQPLDNKLRIQLQKNNFFQKNYRLRYLLVAPILAVPSKKKFSFKKKVIFSSALLGSLLPFSVKVYFREYYLTKFMADGSLTDLENLARQKYNKPKLNQEIFEEIERRTKWEEKMLEKLKK